ncbi:hypothetical protein [Stenomitos frigidus]|uniref:DUF4148 domain-containing protein n=1 Tax=Stenomitos frigidus ULC18 TaxID=2107698 RepID=A0A2T1E5B8_9CYAN|nr:hypothetical protein [Stenomitos frigidus]PSB27844.1 hypothetical protein C7B82_15815 [Stenomitos frigidus ULC18]
MARTTKVSTLLACHPARVTLGFVAAIGLIASFSHSASAQQANVAQPQQIFQDQQNRDPFSSRGNDQAGGVMDLVHRAMQAGSLSNEDFYNQQTENLDSATADFRAAQQQRLKGAPAVPATPSATATPTK